MIWYVKGIIMNDMNVWSKKQFLSMHDMRYMIFSEYILKQPALGLQGVPPWNVDKPKDTSFEPLHLVHLNRSMNVVSKTSAGYVC